MLAVEAYVIVCIVDSFMIAFVGALLRRLPTELTVYLFFCSIECKNGPIRLVVSDIALELQIRFFFSKLLFSVESTCIRQ